MRAVFRSLPVIIYMSQEKQAVYNTVLLDEVLTVFENQPVGNFLSKSKVILPSYLYSRYYLVAIVFYKMCILGYYDLTSWLSLSLLFRVFYKIPVTSHQFTFGFTEALPSTPSQRRLMGSYSYLRNTFMASTYSIFVFFLD
ncbi:hypothetical protein PHYBLDRAFT_58862 [Phycomyces blakesleeanus NRRL 1555(-)]|uniref:Uncharacterized protein n=1 Tax=Phycomyces blakesleeanus (strain ATCC 8743b / DSM 1359 / FGSC 10004 / NBRC 33097 / NRRL 1555) TaxID=763407 RepID=A0A167QJZ9_PHYB8|nr:hypothetical protein PHYBLDRAFT_58862 [Phycomyces blakesleeanus NRRL 1555(-)]OAD79817.1 hypothetical protein PHYBLDRAFT_58862 [Phycomyces blakesleeanus NRRL 1555(-)]|eukprot:XP_018297857.1 hypothetical protein PHYBLDRAFT_58862 [Phycomyces blakesleeanus NRRL 1555(-)]